jgi:hypothetical protein
MGRTSKGQSDSAEESGRIVRQNAANDANSDNGAAYKKVGMQWPDVISKVWQET